uniref:Activin_recp domain-containing protein n=1 Tax=Angiostrongylus cantonensis TaxID=6313 RepID=A0A158PBZ4_ANGCA
MDIREFIVCVFVLCSTVAEAIRCKCTKESESVSCVDGVCEIEFSFCFVLGIILACLMLDHPTLGIHYTCHNKLQKDGFCREKTSKSGALVKICGCNSDDFCNYSYWPDKLVNIRFISRISSHCKSISVSFSDQGKDIISIPCNSVDHRTT